MTTAEPAIACTIEGGLPAMGRRLSDWRAVTRRATGRQPVPGGIALMYDHDPELTVELARLAAAEFACCAFFTFDLVVGPAGLRFTVTAPDEAQDVVTGLVGGGL